MIDSILDGISGFLGRLLIGFLIAAGGFAIGYFAALAERAI